MNGPQDFNSRIRQDLLALVSLADWTASRLARESDVRVNIITRFIKGERQSLRSETLGKLLPFLYGSRRPQGATWEVPMETVPGGAG